MHLKGGGESVKARCKEQDVVYRNFPKGGSIVLIGRSKNQLIIIKGRATEVLPSLDWR